MKTMYTFGELVSKNKIVIPKIQRDYVQGGDDQQEKRCEFSDVLLEHLAFGTDYHLDFIYGTGDVDWCEFPPLDGQQRLTTIFLIHWVPSQRSGANNIDAEDYFSYQTRMSSELFCQKLILEHVDFDSFGEGQTISNYIRKESAWYLKQWDTEPTIRAMLEMIDAVDSALMKYNEKCQMMGGNTLSLLKFDCLYRDQVEKMIDVSKSILNDDINHMQDQDVYDSWMFCNFIALHWYYILRNMLVESEQIKHFSPQNILTELGYHQILNVNGKWTDVERDKKQQNILNNLGLKVMYPYA